MFWVVTSCRDISEGETLRMKAVCFSERLVSTQKPTCVAAKRPALTISSPTSNLNYCFLRTLFHAHCHTFSSWTCKRSTHEGQRRGEGGGQCAVALVTGRIFITMEPRWFVISNHLSVTLSLVLADRAALAHASSV